MKSLVEYILENMEFSKNSLMNNKELHKVLNELKDNNKEIGEKIENALNVIDTAHENDLTKKVKQMSLVNLQKCLIDSSKIELIKDKSGLMFTDKNQPTDEVMDLGYENPVDLGQFTDKLKGIMFKVNQYDDNTWNYMFYVA